MQNVIEKKSRISLLEQMLYQEQLNYAAAIRNDEKFAILQTIKKNINRLEEEIRYNMEIVHVNNKP